ncbi:MAG: hypothetical protein WCX46_02840 [Candidatus Paceibacterota bacterium]
MKNTKNKEKNKSKNFSPHVVNRLLESKILPELVERKIINKFEKVNSGSKDKLNSFRIYYFGNLFFELFLRKAITFRPKNGAEIIEPNGWKIVIVIGAEYFAKKIKTLILSEVLLRRKGLAIERLFSEATQFLINNDEEFRSVIYSVSDTSTVQNRDQKIDKILETDCGNLPIQIKSSLVGQAEHKRNDHGVPSLVIETVEKNNIYFLKTNLEVFRKKIIKIYNSYFNFDFRIIEHL